MQRVRILVATDYAPVAGDGRACWGQLANRPSKRDDGKVGPMVTYFPRGRVPELRDDVAADFIARGIAEPSDVPVATERPIDEVQTQLAELQKT